METRAVGRTGIRLSVVGLGTAQLQMLPERQAVETLVRGFQMGVNWVHTAPDYGGIDPWIQKAVRLSRRSVMVLSAAPAQAKDLNAFFENTCHVYRTPRLSLYGLAGIEDLEWHGENVWGSGGMVQYLQHKKAEGRLDGIYCSTHASADYVIRLIESGVFDAIMLAWNPLGFHQQSQLWARLKIGRDYEDLAEYRQRVFPLAAERGVSLLIMKPFAGGLLCKGKAFPPHDWFADADSIPPQDVLRLILGEPGVCAVVPGCASVKEAEENARAGYAPLAVPAWNRERVGRAVESMRSTLCSRCGKCETTCSHALAIPAMFRDAYIWTSRNETSMANATENYFDLHPSTVLTCDTCMDRTCSCPQGIDIPLALGRVHNRMQTLRGSGQHPGPSSLFPQKTINGRYRVLVHTADVPVQIGARAPVIARFLLQNVGEERWMAAQHTQNSNLATGVAVSIGNRVQAIIPLRNTVCPGEVSPVALEFRALSKPGSHTIRFSLMPLRRAGRDTATIFHSDEIVIEPRRRGALFMRVRPFLRARLARPQPSQISPDSSCSSPYAVEYLNHTIPDRPKAGVTYGVQLTLENTGSAAWCAHAPDGHAVRVLVSIDEMLLAKLPLPQPEVAPAQQVTLHFPFRAHDMPGAHRVRIELAGDGIGTFTAQGIQPWEIDIDVVAAPMTKSVRLFELSRKHNPWYYNPLNGIAESRDNHPLPLFISRGKGCRVWDAEGNEFLEYTMGWGSTILGHADDRIQAAIRPMLDSGAVLAFPHPVEMEVSRMLIEDFPSNDMVVFGKNGSDVCTVAARLARVITKKKIILSCGFHGWQDFALDYFTFEDCGIPDRPERCLYKFTFNDLAGFLQLYDRSKSDLAAVMIEPAGPLINDSEGLGGEPDAEFLHTIADAARRANALLIFDEIITGFRYRQGSVQKATGVVPDLTCLGKALASGMPLSALLGPYRIFLEYFHKTHFCPTFKGEIYSLAAAQAAIQIYRTEPVIEYIWDYGERLRQSIHRVCSQIGIAGECTGPPFRMAFIFREADATRRQLKRTLLMQELLKQRVITVTGMMLPSTAHDEEALRQTTDAFARALEIVAHADRRNALHRYIDLPLL